QPPPAGKIYQLWFVSASGDSIPVGKVEPNTDGNSYLEGKDLPAMDQGKTAMVAIDDPSSKTHGQPLFQAALPKLTPEQHAAEPQKETSPPRGPLRGSLTGPAGPRTLASPHDASFF